MGALPGLAVFDIDGVLADVRHRVRHVMVRPKDWDSFFGAAPLDPVLGDGAALVRAHVAMGHEIAYLTGRPERCRDDTLEWLSRHGLPAGALHMRPDADRRPARFYKVEALARLAARHRIDVVVDDDELVVEMLRAHGYPVVRATWMDGGTSGADEATHALLEAQEQDGRT